MNRITLTYLASYCLSMLGNSIAAIAALLLIDMMTGLSLGHEP
ncbi:MAG TPA: hypothetical protein VGP24_17525 [Glaciihabitans sp.]|jgi:hypothetical protein|nr:hypothetical protein [Glaciihabitans sp.]